MRILKAWMAHTDEAVDHYYLAQEHAVKTYAYSEVCYLLGCAYWHLEDWPQAERYLELAMALRTRIVEFQTEAGAGSWKAMVQLAAPASIWYSATRSRSAIASSR